MTDDQLINNDDVQVFKPEVPFNKKLGNVKFDKIFDTVTLRRAELIMERKSEEFKLGAIEDYNNLKRLFESIPSDSMTVKDYQQISDLAFSIKSRAETGGIAIATNIAKIIYEYCDRAVSKMPNAGYKFIKIAMDALEEAFTGKFNLQDRTKCEKLVSGLSLVADKCA